MLNLPVSQLRIARLRDQIHCYSDLIIILLTLPFYACIFFHDQYIDEGFAVTRNADVTNLEKSTLWDVLIHDFWGQDLWPTDGIHWTHKSFRPIITYSFRISYVLFAGSEYRIFCSLRFINCLVHTLTCLVMKRIWFFRRNIYAVFLFAVHPVHVENIVYMVGRADSLATLFFLLGVDSFAYGKVFVCTVVAGLCKETAFTLPILVAFLCLIRKQWVRAGCFLLMFVAVFAVRSAFVGGTDAAFGYVDTPVKYMDDMVVRFWSYLLHHSVYAGLLVLPYNLSWDYSFDSLPIVFEKHLDLRMMGVFTSYTFMVLMFYMAIPRRQKQWKVTTDNDEHARYRILRQNDDILTDLFAAGMVVVPFVPASNLIFLVGTTIGERLLYPCSVGSCLLISRLFLEEDALLGLGTGTGPAWYEEQHGGGGGEHDGQDGDKVADGSGESRAASPLEGSKDSYVGVTGMIDDNEDHVLAEALAILDAGGNGEEVVDFRAKGVDDSSDQSGSPVSQSFGRSVSAPSAGAVSRAVLRESTPATSFVLTAPSRSTLSLGYNFSPRTTLNGNNRFSKRFFTASYFRSLIKIVYMVYMMWIGYTRMTHWRSKDVLFEVDALASRWQPRSAKVLHQHAVLLQARGDADKAMDYYQKALDVFDDNAMSDYCIARILLEKGDCEKALKVFFKINDGHGIGFGDHNQFLLNNDFGYALTCMSAWAEAIPILEEALQLMNPNFPYIYNSLALAHFYHNKDPQKVMDLLNMGIQVHPDNFQLWFNAAVVMIQNGSYENGQKAFAEAEKVVKTIEDYQALQAAIEKINQGKLAEVQLLFLKVHTART